MERPSFSAIAFLTRPEARPRSRVCAALGCAGLVASCSTIQSQPLNTVTSPQSVGLVYYLPIRTLAVDAKFQILDCGLNTKTNKAELVYDLVPTVTTDITADRRRGFTIAKGLDGKLLKAMNFEVVQYENGTLKSVNLVADDRTGQVATNILSGALKFGLALTGGALFSRKEETEPEIIWLRTIDPTDGNKVDRVKRVCGEAPTDALLRVHALARQLSGAREVAEAKAKAAANLTEAQKALEDARASLKAANEAGGAEDIAQAKDVLAAAVKDLGEARAAAKTAPTSPSSSAISQDIAATVQRHLTFSASDTLVPTESVTNQGWTIAYPKERLDVAGIKTLTDLNARIQLTPSYAFKNETDPAAIFAAAGELGPAADGIWLRSPAQARLEIFDDVVGETTSRLSQFISVPQWGQLTRLPLRNMAFAKNTTKLAFAPDGALLSLTSDATAAAEGASGAWAQSGEMVLDYATKRRALLQELTAANNAADKASIQQQIDLLGLQQQLTAAQSNVGPQREGQLATLNFQIQQAQKQIELLDLQAKLQALQAAPQ